MRALVKVFVEELAFDPGAADHELELVAVLAAGGNEAGGENAAPDVPEFLIAVVDPGASGLSQVGDGIDERGFLFRIGEVEVNGDAAGFEDLRPGGFEVELVGE
jgi:hypothetical protein